MKRTKKLLSFFLAIVMVITAFAVVPFTTTAAELTSSSYGLMAGRGSTIRYRVKNTNMYNICNDGSSDNFTIAYWKYDISSLSSNSNINTANLKGTIDYNNCNGCKGINFYAINPSYNISYSATGTVNSSFNSGGTAAVTNILNTYSDRVDIGTVYYNTTSMDISFANALKTVVGKGWKQLVVLAVPNYNTTHATDGNSWSDAWLYPPTVSFTVSESSTNIDKTNNENSVTNRVVLKDAIYTYYSADAYYNYGNAISVEDNYHTEVKVDPGYVVTNVVCIDDNSKLSVNGAGRLSGTFSNDKFKVSGKKDVSATLKFTFDDGKVEYHRVAVKSYPIENHASVQSWYSRWNGNRESGYTMYLRGSTGSNGSGLFKDYKKFYGSYSASGDSAYGYNADSASNILTNVDKKAGRGATNEGDATPTPGLASYYIDKSCRGTDWANLGNSELWNGTNYSIQIDMVRTRFQDPLGDMGSTSTPRNTTGATLTGSYTRSDTNGYTSTFKLTSTSSITKASDYNFMYNIQNTNGGSARMSTNIEVFLFDKSTARSRYNELINENLVENNYTASSFAAYQNALLNLEAYLSNYEDTDTSTKSTNLVNALNTAKSNLVKRGNTQAVLNKLAEYQSVTANQSKYTPSSYNSFLNEQLNPSDANLTAAIQLGRDTYAQRDLTVAQETAYLTSLQNILNILKLRADFTNYNTALNVATNSTDGYLIPYTSGSVSTLPTYNALKMYDGITIYTNQDNIDDSHQTEINAAANALVAANTAVYTDTIDQTTLQAFVSHIATFDKDVYDETAVNKVKSNINDIYKTVSFNGVDYYSLDVTDQADYDSKLRSFMNSFNSALDEYTVTVPSNVTAKVNGIEPAKTVSGDTKTYTLAYGTNVTFTTDDNALTAWYMDYASNVTSRGKQFQKHAESFTTKIIGSITIYAESASDSASCVTIVRQYDQANVSPALDRVSYVTTGNAYTLPTEPTRVANYNFIGYYVKGTKITDASVTISADTQIVAMYQYVGAEIDVTTYAIDGTSATTKYAYNANVTIDEPSAYAWVEQVGTSDTWRPFYIGTTCTFKVSEPTVLKPVTETEFKAMFTDEAYAPILRQNGAVADEAGRAVINAQRIDYLPSGAEIQEFGILVSKDAASDFDLVNNVNTIRCKSSQELDKVQFTIFLKGAGSSTFTYRSYMIYKLADGTIKTVYSDVANYPVTNA